MRSLLLLLALAQLPPEALRLLREQRPREAALVLEQELARRPEQGELRRALVRVLLDLEQSERALALAQGFPELDALRARALHALGRLEEALPLLERGGADELLLAADALDALGRQEGVAAVLARAEALLGAEHPAALVLRGRERARAGRHEEAADCFRRARAADPLDARALFGLGRALVFLGRREEGLAVLEEHRRLLPLLDRLEFARAGLALDPAHAPNHAALGDVERELGRTDAAEAEYRAALALARGDEVVPVALRLARLLDEDRADGAAAIALLRAAQERSPDVRLAVREGDLLEARGERDAAVEAWRRAARSRPGDPAIAERLARAGAAER